jgi:hypothetical protein
VEKNVSRWKHTGKQGNNISATKITLGKHQMFLNLAGNIFASRITNHKWFRDNVS